ncbi:MAG: hypothetical protein KDE55_06915 [Novosphingobium sp.]|nr:hypothetical protein [Novosphingobium sp.]
MHRRLVLASLIALATGQPVTAKPVDLSPEARAVLGELVEQSRSDRTPEVMAAYVRSLVLGLDMDGGGLSRKDLEIRRKLDVANSRATAMQRYLRLDLDGDGNASREEYGAVMLENYAELEHTIDDEARDAGKAPDYRKLFPGYPDLKSHEDFRDDMARYDSVDTDKDGSISLREAFDATAIHDRRRPDPLTEEYRYLALDLNGDGNVSPKEIDRAVAAFMLEYEKAADWDSRPPSKHNVRWSGIVIEDGMEPGTVGAAPSCAFPRPSGKALLVRVGIYHGDRLSNIALAGQNKPTRVAAVDIEPGEVPLYIVASQFDATVWQFTGAVERVEQLVIASYQTDDLGQPAFGVTGIAPGKVKGMRLACIGKLHGQPENPEATEIGKLMKEHFGRLPDVMVGQYTASGLTLPGGERFQLPLNRPAALRSRADQDVEAEWSELKRYHPGGVAEVDPRTLASYVRPEAYRTLPMEAGIVQLMIEGKLIRTRYGELIVQQPMRLPSGLHGGHLRKFIVPQGVAAPMGDPGHSCVTFRDSSGSDPRFPPC